MQLFTLAFQRPIEFGASAFVVTVMIVVLAKAALSSDGKARWTRRITGPNSKWLFAFLAIGWALVFGVGLQLVHHEGANSPYGGLGLIALFSGFFIMMGFLWSVIGE